MTPARLSLSGASWRAPDGATILMPATFDLDPGRILGIVGSNGAGKSTLLRLVYRYLKPTSGSVLVDGEDIWSKDARSFARKIAAVLQEQPTDFALDVHEIVELGRIPHSSSREHDAAVVSAAIERLELTSVSRRRFGFLSGGERQRVMVARALAQEPSLLVLDEPTNHLDIRHQLEVIELIRSLDITVVTSLHDINLAASVCDSILLLEQGQVVAFGPPGEVLSDMAVSRAFRVRARREQLNPSQTPHFTYQLNP